MDHTFLPSQSSAKTILWSLRAAWAKDAVMLQDELCGSIVIPGQNEPPPPPQLSKPKQLEVEKHSCDNWSEEFISGWMKNVVQLSIGGEMSLKDELSQSR
jgi:hypothetical protein